MDILQSYIPYKTSLREVARICNTDHHTVKRVLEAAGIPIVKGKRKPFTAEHREKIGRASKGRTSWCKGKKMSKDVKFKNMAAHLRFDVSWEWLRQYEDIEKLKCLNDAITNRSGRFNLSTDEYEKYIRKFYDDSQFNQIYQNWIMDKQSYKKPSLDHIIPRSKGGTNSLDNWQFLTWFENRCKNNLTQDQWNCMKQHLSEYLV